ncbi:MAG: LysR family transcriptional regulator, partial [Eubacteriales bacterium]|nr:LysR family transcriptional regulator [Eubacteriales bacterium]
MDIRVLKYFLAVANEESISKAAKTLHIAQPPLSREMKKLEQEVGKQLLIRGSKRITLTEEGLLLKKRAQEIIDLLQKTENELSCDEGDVAGDVYIGCGETDSIFYFAQAANNLKKRYPGIRYHIYSGDAEQVTEKLDKGLIDFGLLIGYRDLKKYNSLRLPVVDTWGVLMHKDSPLAEKDRITPEDLYDCPLILPYQTIQSDIFEHWFGSSEFKNHIMATANLIYNGSLFVKAGFGYALTLNKLTNTGAESELCFRPLYPELTTELDIVWKRHQVFSHSARIY